MTDTIEKFLSDLLKDYEGKHYLFRGTPLRYSKKVEDGINSSLYRWAKDKVVFHENYLPFDMEQEILGRAAKRHYAVGVKSIEVMTDLQHFHGKTNLIDFSRDPYIALFFACDGEHHKDPGELIILDPANIRGEEQGFIRLDPTPCLMESAKTKYSKERVHFQNSVFVYPPYGYINKNLCAIEKIPANLKQPILDHLRKIYDIHTDTIYNDLIGFITNENNYRTSSVLFYESLSLSGKGDYEEAIEKYNEAIKLNSNYTELYNNRGVAKYELGQYREAIDDYDRAIELNQNNVGAYNNRGNTKIKLGQYPEAIADYDKAIKLDPNNTEPYNNRGAAKNNLGQHREAISDFNKAIELEPNNADAYNNRGLAKSNLEKYPEAIADYDKAIELNPNKAIAYNNRGNVKNSLGQQRNNLNLIQSAIVDYDKAIELNPKYVEAYNNRGTAKGKLGQHQKEIADYNKAIELNPNYAEAYYNRSLANRALGRTQEANEDFKTATKLRGDETS